MSPPNEYPTIKVRSGSEVRLLPRLTKMELASEKTLKRKPHISILGQNDAAS